MKLNKFTEKKKNDIEKKSKNIVLNSISGKQKILYHLYHIFIVIILVFFFFAFFASLLLLQYILNQKTGSIEIFFVVGFFVLVAAFTFLNIKYADLLSSLDNKIAIKENELFLFEHRDKICNITSPMKTWLALFYNRERDKADFPYHNEKFKQFYCDIKENINQQDENGDTLLHYILEHEPHSPFVAQALLMNADIHIKNHKGVSPYDLILLHTPEYIVCLEKLNISATIPNPASFKKPASRL